MADVRFESSRALGDVWALTELWDELGFGELLRAMDALVEHQGRVQAALAGLLRPLIDQDLSVVFDDMTTIGVEG